MSQKPDSNKTRDAVSLGETMLLFQAEEYGALRHNERFRKFIGGTESNTMMALAKLGLTASWISRLGADEFGYNIRDFIRGQGVDTSGVVFDQEAPTGVFFVEKNAMDETRSLYYRTGSAASRMSFQGLDPDGINRMLDLIVSLAKTTGITVLLSSHLLHQVQRICDRVGIMRQGRLVDQGSIKELAQKLGQGREEATLEEIYMRYFQED